jgi:hypothetical protein
MNVAYDSSGSALAVRAWSLAPGAVRTVHHYPCMARLFDSAGFSFDLRIAGDAAVGARKRCDTSEMRRLRSRLLLACALAAAGKTLQTGVRAGTVFR